MEPASAMNLTPAEILLSRLLEIQNFEETHICYVEKDLEATTPFIVCEQLRLRKFPKNSTKQPLKHTKVN